MEKMENKSVQMPYSESEEYLDALVSRVTEKAVEEGRTQRKSLRGLLWITASLAAAAAVLLFVFIGRGEKADGPIDKYLASLSDDELMELSCYEVENWNYDSSSQETYMEYSEE